MGNFAPGSFVFVMTIVANVVVAAFVYANNPKSATNRLFLALSAAVSVWLTAMFATNVPAFAPWYLELAKSTLVLATPMNLLFFLFARTVPDERLRLGKRTLGVLVGATVAVTAMAASPLAFSGLRYFAGRPETIPGPGLPIFGLFSIGLNLAAVITLFLKARRAQGKERLQLRLVTLGVLAMFGLIFGTIFVPVLLLGDSTFVALSPLYVLLFTAMTGYAIFGRRMLNVSVATAELVSATLVLINAVQIFLASSYIDFGFRLITFIFVVIVAFRLIVSVRGEIERRKELQDLTLQLRDANDHLKEADKLKSEFISIASHQLRTPITVIKGYVSLMLEGAYGPINGAVREKIESMNVMNERLVQMINNMLNVSRIERNRIEFSCTKIDLGPLVREVVEEMADKARQKGLRLGAAVPEGEAIEAYIDSDKVQEVLTNLVDNAIKYTPSGSVTVAVRKLPKKKEMLVTVVDTGLGMDKETAGHVFQKFFRSKDPDIVREVGTGLGLYICAMFIRGMGGDIWVDKTEPGKGTTIAFRLPTEAGGQCLPKDRRRLA